MSDFFERLAGLIHWFGFLVSLFLAYIFITETSTDPFWLQVLIILMPNTAAWLIKFVFTGNGNFLPF